MGESSPRQTGRGLEAEMIKSDVGNLSSPESIDAVNESQPGHMDPISTHLNVSH